MARGFVYLAGVLDWFIRRVLVWRLSITMAVEFCCEAVEDSPAEYGRPEIFNTDQGAPFPSGRRFTYRRRNAVSTWPSTSRYTDGRTCAFAGRAFLNANGG
jgi:transposase InsO family protein